MGFPYNTSGAAPEGLIPNGRYKFIIKKVIEKKSKKGDPLVSMVCKVLEGPEAGKELWHMVAFVPGSEKAAGIAKHFLKAVGQPFEGEIEVNPEDWEGADFEAEVGTEEYGNKIKNIITEVYSPDGQFPEQDVPF